MFPFQSSEYQQLPVEEKVEDEQPQAPVKKRNNKAFVALVVCLIAFASLFAFLGTRSSKHDDESQQQIFEEAAEAEFASFLNGEARATGQQYLLGVGKADITGLVLPKAMCGVLLTLVDPWLNSISWDTHL